MLELDTAKEKLQEIEEKLAAAGDALDTPKLEREIAELSQKQNEENFWNDLENAQIVNKQLVRTQNKLNGYIKLVKRAEDVRALIELSEESETDSEVEEIKGELKLLEKESEELWLTTLFKGKYDENNAILTLHAGAGGTEAQDWTSMLFRMYTRYSERHNYKTEILDHLPGDEAGIKSVTFSVSGENAYGYLKAEKGVHRLVRISPFDANSRRHTSFASLEVMPEIETDTEIKINPEELRVDTYRSGGAGGQHINKTDSAVRITHLPTGVVVQCQNERSQIQNRERAMKMLTSKLIELKERENAEKEAAIKGDLKKIEWGSQIRSYVFCPYTMVKDHRTGVETANVDGVMDGDIDMFITEYLKRS